MRPSLPQHDPLDLRSTPIARLPITLVDLEVVLVISATIHPIDASAVAPDSRL